MPTVYEQTDYRELLRLELAARRARRPSYSQRAFARDLGLRANRLSEILGGKQGLSARTAQLVSERLSYSPLEANYFRDLVAACHDRDPEERRAAAGRAAELRELQKYRPLSLDQFRLVAQWYHLAILELTKLEDFESSTDWIASRLSITRAQALEAVERLKRVGLLEVRDGRLQPKGADNMVSGTIPSAAIKRFHDGCLRLARQALKDQPMERREFSATLMAVDAARLPEIRQRIDQFWKRLDKELGRDERRTDVYCLGVQFFSLTEGQGRA